MPIPDSDPSLGSSKSSVASKTTSQPFNVDVNNEAMSQLFEASAVAALPEPKTKVNQNILEAPHTCGRSKALQLMCPSETVAMSCNACFGNYIDAKLGEMTPEKRCRIEKEILEILFSRRTAQ